MKHRIVIEIEIDGSDVDTTLLFDGAPVAGHGDSTYTLPVDALLKLLVRQASRRAVELRMAGAPPDIPEED